MLQIKHANKRIYSHILRTLAQWESVRLVLDGPLFPCCEQRALSVISNNTDNECNFCRRAHMQYQHTQTHTHVHILVVCASHIHRYRQFKTCFWYFTSEWFHMPSASCRCRFPQMLEKSKADHRCSLHCLHAAQVHMLPTPGVANVIALHWFCPTRRLVFILFQGAVPRF